jgi:nucleoside-diphosphate-sugar epimerase
VVKIAITGGAGQIGQALIANLDPGRFEITSLDLPDHDVSDLEHLVEATKGQDALLHFAWANLGATYGARRIDPRNNQMTFNVYRAAVTNGVTRVLMASSNHAHRHDLRDTDGRVRASIEPAVPDSPYGAEKVFMEALGRYFAHEHGLDVICLRIGNVNRADVPNQDAPPRWLSHADLGRLVTACLLAERVPDHFQIVYGVSRQDVFDWSNPFGYEPQDGP